MDMLTKWYRRLPAPYHTAGRYVLAVFGTIILLIIYHVLANPDYPYLIGLFPVIAAAIVLGPGPGLASLIVTTLYINAAIEKPSSPEISYIFIAAFLVEGFVVLWMVAQRQQARLRLARNLIQREIELAKLRKVHDQLVADASRRDQSIQQVQDSNEIMVKTLERILDEHHLS